MNSFPYEVVAAPVDVYFAPLTTACPALADAPAAPWTLIGSQGNLNITNEGVTVEHSQSITKWRALGDCGSRKAFRTEEDLVIRFTIADITLEQYAHAINEANLTLVTGGKHIGLSRGSDVATMALLLRGVSPYGATGALQYYIPVAAQTGSPTVVYRKDEPAGLLLEFSALVDPTADPSERFGYLEAADADAS